MDMNHQPFVGRFIHPGFKLQSHLPSFIDEYLIAKGRLTDKSAFINRCGLIGFLYRLRRCRLTADLSHYGP